MPLRIANTSHNRPIILLLRPRWCQWCIPRPAVRAADGRCPILPLPHLGILFRPTRADSDVVTASHDTGPGIVRPFIARTLR